MRTPEVNLSELSLHPRRVTDQLEGSPTRSVRIRRREKDKPDLVLVTAERAEQAAAGFSAAVAILVELLRRSAETVALAAEALPAAFPWARYLSAEEVRTFVGELAETLERTESLGNPAPFAALVAKWKQAAEAHADPELAEIVRRNDHNGQTSGRVS
ncbi:MULTISPECIES: hypothetical protein [Amycolatopsis]|uniref:Prevent-host-death family protein n=1 Tax=Amycolatopsis dendrobii TaxID=2760662 RepID=A0A7W3VT13_9PSEU|nr:MULTISPECIES: hypothetical protein [Amycolatopsis]MBB1152570.1 hypothetical protein [Amycolatopsis dendrobii]UKD52243.1 hypothetical protein L3Q65_30565 [Amycolatopsis sp. FU40]